MGRGEGPRKSLFTKRHATALPRVKPAKIVGSIAGEPYNMVWVVSSLRKDKKTGVLDPVPQDPYAELLFSSCFKKWREDDGREFESSTTPRE
ncbi:hypothetical protein CN961_24160 [Bacillus thuringiensis]|uniref:hypothetical protein n=1 Tax=Bacillus thuringiensis TaxID=1428 RepID=UPI000BFDE5CF|nr:hypothetical protein [Bacillus thuringiensis]PGN54922.1 hypothetical protein CN961_24160 [Bacillus thuringiensis]HDR8474912.1 hypothetical protein [Bacillus cereus]